MNADLCQTGTLYFSSTLVGQTELVWLETNVLCPTYKL